MDDELGGASHWVADAPLAIGSDTYSNDVTSPLDTIETTAFRNSFEYTGADDSHVFFRPRVQSLSDAACNPLPFDDTIEAPSTSTAVHQVLNLNHTSPVIEPRKPPTVTRLFAALRQQLPVAQPELDLSTLERPAMTLPSSPTSVKDAVVDGTSAYNAASAGPDMNDDDSLVGAEHLRMSLRQVVSTKTNITKPVMRKPAVKPKVPKNNMDALPTDASRGRAASKERDLKFTVLAPPLPPKFRQSDTIEPQMPTQKQEQTQHTEPTQNTANPSSHILAAWKAKRSVLRGDGAECPSSPVYHDTRPTHTYDDDVPLHAGDFEHTYIDAATAVERSRPYAAPVPERVNAVQEPGPVPAVKAQGDKGLAGILQQKIENLEEQIVEYEHQVGHLKNAEEKVRQQEKSLDEERKRLAEARAEFLKWKSEESKKTEQFKKDLMEKVEKERQKILRDVRAAASASSASERREKLDVEALKAEISKLRADLAASELKYKSTMERHKILSQRKDSEIQAMKEQLQLYEAKRIEATFEDQRPPTKKTGSQSVSKAKHPRHEHQLPKADMEPEHVPVGVAEEGGHEEPDRVVNVRHEDVTAGIKTVQPASAVALSPQMIAHVAFKLEAGTIGLSSTLHSAPLSEESLDGGKRELMYADGTRLLIFKNSTEKEVCPGGAELIRYSNGDVKRDLPLGNGSNAEAYYFADSGVIHTTYPDGAQAYNFPNGQIEMHQAHGIVEVLFPDGSSSVRKLEN